jgi:hypothetical protein
MSIKSLLPASFMMPLTCAAHDGQLGYRPPFPQAQPRDAAALISFDQLVPMQISRSSLRFHSIRLYSSAILVTVSTTSLMDARFSVYAFRRSLHWQALA